VPLASLGTALLDPKYAADGSALFNIARNLGGSVGTALPRYNCRSTGTISRFSNRRVRESISLSRSRSLKPISSIFTAKGYDPGDGDEERLCAIETIIETGSVR